MEDGNIMKDTSVVLEIPAATTIAYGIIELYVKQDGRFGECHFLQMLRGPPYHVSPRHTLYRIPLCFWVMGEVAEGLRGVYHGQVTRWTGLAGGAER